MLEHGVEGYEQLSHAGCEGRFLGLTGGQQTLVVSPFGPPDGESARGPRGAVPRSPSCLVLAALG